MRRQKPLPNMSSVERMEEKRISHNFSISTLEPRVDHILNEEKVDLSLVVLQRE